ncbi:MAG: MFS transporter [Firmicutes bacterium]|nr:MFS transporter [Bacillota bacterium]
MIKQTRKVNPLQVLVLVFFASAAYGMVLQSIPPLLPAIIGDLNLFHAQGGLLMSLFALPGIFLSLPGGMLADVYGPKRVGSLSLLLLTTGTLVVGLGKTFGTLALGRIIAGAGGTAIIIIAAQSISLAFMDDRRLGLAMGLFTLSVPTGTVFSHVVFSRLVLKWGWSMTVMASALICLVILFFFWKFFHLETDTNISVESSREKRPGLLDNFKRGKGYQGVWLLSISWLLYMGAKMALLTFAPEYFSNVGYDYAFAGLMSGVLSMASIVVAPLTGYLLGRTGNAEKYLIFAGITLSASIILLGTASSGHMPLVIICSIAIAVFPPTVFFIVPMLLPAKNLGQGFGILRICENTGMLLWPALVGLSYDLSGTYSYGFSIMSASALGAAVIAITLIPLMRRFTAEEKFVGVGARSREQN